MQNTARQFLLKVAELPEEVSFYFQSKTLNDAINDLCKNHKLQAGYLGELIDELTINDFNFENLKNKLKNDLNINDEEARQVFVDYLGKIFLPIDSFIKTNVHEEVKKQGGDIGDYRIFVEEFEDEIEEKKNESLGDLVDKYKELVDLEEEKKSVIAIFESNLTYVLKKSSYDALLNLNNGLMILLKNLTGFKDETSRLLFMNGELLTHENFELEGKPHSPTIGNWIQDFIVYSGSGMFSNLALTKYLTDSENAKRLPPEEKRLVHKLLQLYRNLKFFPESLENIPVEEWEIIPVNRDKGASDQFKRVIGPPKTEEEKQIDILKQEEAGFAEDGLERLAIEEEIENKKKLEGLRIEANRYVTGSLERMAVEEEVRRLEGRS